MTSPCEVRAETLKDLLDGKGEPHPFSAMFPPITAEDFDKLVDDIKKNGLLQAIVVYQGKILDGNNRYRACLQARIKPRFTELVEAGDAQAQAYVISANIHRRHLSLEQRREIIATLLKADSTKSNRQIGETTKADHKTVGAVRAGSEACGEIPHTETTTDTTGRKQKTRKPRTEKQKVQDRYKTKQEELIDVLQEFPSWQHAEEYAERTKERLDETVHGMQDGERTAAA
jgi:ParB-like chromosome segregation protein Spo0J